MQCRADGGPSGLPFHPSLSGEFLSPQYPFLPLLSMITHVTHTLQAATVNDAQLVAASLAGDRQAYGQIVERYQNLVCSIAYNATGSLVALLVLGWRQLKKAGKRTGQSNGPTTILLLSTVIGLGSQHAFAKPPAPESVTLTNGIRVVGVYFSGSTNVAIFTYLPMSLTSDGPKQSQWAHLVEHLVIRSTVPADSPIANAETLPDHMRLDFYGSTNNWRDGLEHHAKWLSGLPFAQSNLDAERPKVNAECDFTAKNFATHKFAMAAWAQGYRHNQNHAALKGDILKATLGEIQKCRDERLAVLSNVVVCAVGGVEPAQLLAACREKLGTIKSSANPVLPVKTHAQNREMTWDLDARHLVLTWAMPSVEKDDYAALLVAAQWLNLRFFGDEDLKKLTGMTLAGADLTAPEGNFFFVSASLRPGAAFKEARGMIDRHLERLRSEKESPAMMSMIGKQLSEQLTQGIDPDSLKGRLPPGLTPGMLEMNLGLQWGMNEFRYGLQKAALAQRLAATDANKVLQSARNHLAGDKCTMITIQPAQNIYGSVAEF